MKRLILLSLIFPVSAFADDPFACVDKEFTDAFLGNAYFGRPTYSTELPDVFGELPVPDFLSLIGSEFSSHSIRAIYSTDTAAEEAVSAAVEEISGDEWRNLPDAMQMRSRGFQNPAVPRMARLCRDIEPGLLSINASESGGRTYLSVSLTNYSNGQTCADLEAQSDGRSYRGPLDYMEDLPDLTLPDDAQTAGTGQGGNGNEYYSQVIVNTAMSRDSLVSFLGDQIRDQGWVYDTTWSGNLSAGTIWSKSPPDEETLIGILHAYGEKPGTYHVRFGVSTAKTGTFSGVRFGNTAIMRD